MALKPNLEYWQISLDNPESVGEIFYRHDEIIVENETYLSITTQLRELITTYCILQEIGAEVSAVEQVIASIDSILKSTPNIQYTEFVAYWKCLDITFSVYKATDDDTQRLKILKEALNEYCRRRRRLYDRLGYGHTVQQALYDSAKSRSQGTAGVQKVETLLQEVMGESGRKVRVVEEFRNTPTCWLAINSKETFAQLLHSLGARYSFGKAHQKKIPDLAAKFYETVFIIEARHIKEPGGAQDKQIRELIAFISQKESGNSPIRYVAFLDGLYFNIIATAKEGTNPYRQRIDIQNALRHTPSNYFVNTAGLRQLFKMLSGSPSRRLPHKRCIKTSTRSVRYTFP